MSAEEAQAKGDSSPGVLLASGYIAGGALAGIVIAFSAGVLGGVDQALGEWAERNNPFFAGPWSDALSVLPYLLLLAGLYRAAGHVSHPPEQLRSRPCASGRP